MRRAFIIPWGDTLPILIEEFLSDLENALKEKDTLRILSVIKRHEEIDDPLLEDEEASEKLKLLVDYLKPIKKLPEKRRIKRIENAIDMISRYKKWFFFQSPSCEGDLKDPETDIKFAKGVGPSRAKTLKKLGIEKIIDLVWYIPRDYEDRRKIVPLGEIVEGKYTTKGRITSTDVKKLRKVNVISATLTDGVKTAVLKWFNQDYLYESIRSLKGKEVIVTGSFKRNMFGSLESNSPEVVPYDKSFQREILPIYSLTSGISQKVIRKIFRENLKHSICKFEDDFPDFLKDKRELAEKKTALQGVHFPKTIYHLKESKRRLSYEELFYFQLALAMSRQTQKKLGGIPKDIRGNLARDFLKDLPFELTNAQRRVHFEIRENMESESPMNRLLQGDVGSGKTVVAQLAMLDNHEAGFQSAMMAPTLILAVQHYRRMEKLEKYGVKIALLTGSTPSSQKNKIKAALKNGSIDVIVGTHALIQSDVHFKNLGLVIIDEQHRFGVKQREELMNKGKLVDTLVMTATPIPRTLSLTLYGDLDVSVIDEMPPGRKPVRTMMVPVSRSHEVFNFIREEVKMGRQAFIVYPLIEESDRLMLKAATEMYEYLSKKVFPDISVGLLHGRMPDGEKEEVMEKFASKEFSVLVSTTVIEVGIDVPDATVMVVENPERFGLAQLHQLRGRVGRSKHQAYCFLLYGDLDEEAYKRLKFFESTTDGFKIAEYDLQLRGPGEFLGTKQHGLPEFKFADIIRDKIELSQAREDAFELVEGDPDLSKHKYLYEKIRSKYGDRIKLLEVG